MAAGERRDTGLQFMWRQTRDPDPTMDDKLPTSGVEVFFEPESIALVGVSGRPDSFTAQALRFLIRDYAGPVYPVNPKYDSISELRCYPTLGDIGAPVDLVLCMLPAAAATDAVRQAGAVGARGVTIFASGFGEAGPAGEALQAELMSTATRVGVRVVGPNCQGTVNFHNGTTASFSRALDHVDQAPGKVAYLGQSGAVGSSVLNLAQERGLGYSLWASTGNQADVDVADLASYAVADDRTEVLMLYVEDVRDGHRLVRTIAQAAERGKHIVLLRSGRSAEGRRASRSHTGAIVGDDLLAFDLAARRAGAVLVEDLDEMLDAAGLLASLSIGSGGNRLGVVTTSGAAGILAADLADRHGFTVPLLSVGTQETLRQQLPEFAANANPIDVTYQFFSRESPFIEKPGGTTPMQDLIRTLAGSGDVDSVMVILGMLVGDMAKALVEDIATMVRELPIPLLFVWLGGHELTREARIVQRRQSLPAFASIGAALRIGALLRQAHPRPRWSAGPAAWNAETDDELNRLTDAGLPTEGDANRLLDVIGVARPESEQVQSPEAAAAVARRFGTPVVLKLQVPGLEHKSEAGAVVLDVAPDEAEAATRRLMSLDTDAVGVLVVRTAPEGLDVLVSARQLDPGQPTLVSVGLGGVGAEIDPDIVHDVMPTDRALLEAGLGALRSAPILTGYRGRPALDTAALADIAFRVGSAVSQSNGRLRELELNPVRLFARGHGALALDALAVTGAPFRQPDPPSTQHGVEGTAEGNMR